MRWYVPHTSPAGRLRLVLPAQQLREGQNVLAVQVYNQSEFGGLVGIPTVALDDEVLLAETGSITALLERSGDLPAGRLLDLCDYLVHSGRASEAAGICGNLLDSPGADAPTRHRARSRLVHALWFEGRAEEGWKEFENLDFTRPIPYHAAAVAARLRPARGDAAKGVIYIGRDTELKGDWDFRYGREAAVLCAMGAPSDLTYGEIDTKLDYNVEVGSGEQVPRAWIGAKKSDDPRGLYCPLIDARRYSSWDDRGEVRPFDDKGPDLVLKLRIPKGEHVLALYLVDWDWFSTGHPRMQTITVLDSRGLPLVTMSTGKFGEGQYERFMVAGPRNLTFRISKHRSPCAVLSGVFLNHLFPLQPLEKPTETSPAYAELARDYEELMIDSRKSVIGVTQSIELSQFVKKCTEARELIGSPRHWWLSESNRIRGEYAVSTEHLKNYVSTIQETFTFADVQYRVLRSMARDFVVRSYRAEATLLVLQAAISRMEEEKSLERSAHALRYPIYEWVASRWHGRSSQR